MIGLAIATVAVFGIALVMAKTGRGGGNFYVPGLVSGGATMHGAATTAQLTLVCSAAPELLVFQRSRRVDWKLVLVIDARTLNELFAYTTLAAAAFMAVSTAMISGG